MWHAHHGVEDFVASSKRELEVHAKYLDLLAYLVRLSYFEYKISLSGRSCKVIKFSYIYILGN